MRKKILLVITGICAVILGYFGFASVTFGNPSFISQNSSCKTASATTSGSYMTSGNATTTLVCDMYKTNDILTGTAADSGTLLVQFNASSTPTFNIALEYSNGKDGVNCASTPNTCDWYENNLDMNFASTTSPFNLATINTISFKFASSTPGGQSSSIAPLIPIDPTSSRVDKIITIPTPTRYVRAVFTLTGSGNSSKGTIWAEFIPKKEMK